MTKTKLEAAQRDIIAEYTRFELPFYWGSGQVAIADGTHVGMYGRGVEGVIVRIGWDKRGFSRDR